MQKFNFVYKKILASFAGDQVHYELSFDDKKFLLTETATVEIIVSLLRAHEELNFLRRRRPMILESTHRLPLIIIDKQLSCGLIVSVSEMIVEATLEGQKIFTLSLEKFAELIAVLYALLNAEYGKSAVDFKIFHPIYLEHMLGIDIPNLIGASHERQKISDLRIFSVNDQRKGIHVTEGDLYRQLQSGRFSEEKFCTTNHLFESGEERMRNILTESLLQPHVSRDRALVVYNDEQIIRDGAHRLTCLYYLYGDIDVPVLRLRFSSVRYSYSMFRKFG